MWKSIRFQAEFGVGLGAELVLARTEKLGYCDRCGENTYFRLVNAQFLRRPLAWCLTRVAAGPWFCGQCRYERQTIHRPLKSSAGVDDRAGASVSVGNFIRGESSLVMQSTRSNRYTEKFRAGVVRRVLEGKQSLAQIADELDVPQADLLVWVAQQFDQKQQQIENLTRAVEQLSELGCDQAKIETRIDLEIPESATERGFGQSDQSGTVEGRVN